MRTISSSQYFKLLLLFLLLLTTAVANAQSYSYQLASGYPTGGVSTNSGGSRPYVVGNGGYGGGISDVRGTAASSGTVTYVYNWSGPAGTYPPYVVEKLTCNATAGGESFSCANSFGNPASTLTPINEGITGTHYKVVPGTASITINFIGAQATGTAGMVNGVNLSGTSAIFTSVALTPITLTISGGDTSAPLYSSTQPGFLIGQQQIATVNCGVGTLSSFIWNVTGPNVFSDAVFTGPASAPTSFSYTPFTSVNSNGCSYSCGTTGTVSISCKVTLTTPDNVVQPQLSLNASETASAPDPGSQVYIMLKNGTSAVANWSDPMGNPGIQLYTLGPGMTFNMWVQTPAPFYTDEGAGKFFPVQLVMYNNTGTGQITSTGQILPLSNPSTSPGYAPGASGSYSLDTSYPYAAGEAALDPTKPTKNYTTTDNPSYRAALPTSTGATVYSLKTNWSAKMFLVYTAPVAYSGQVVYPVPLSEYTWDWDANWTAPLSNLPIGYPQPLTRTSTGFLDFSWSSYVQSSS